MEGIFGLYRVTSDSEIEKMSNRLRHRGTHEYIERISDHLVFGLRSDNEKNGVYKNDNFTVIAQSTLYNSDQLTTQLEKSTDPKTSPWLNEEIILSLYKRHGFIGLNQINGSFASAIWEKQNEKLILCRDFFGCCPLYYTLLPDGDFAFSSEYKALLSLNDINYEIDLDMVQHLQNCKKLPIGKTLLKNIMSVPPGCALIYDTKTKTIKKDFLPAEDYNVYYTTEEDAAVKLKNSLYKAIDLRINKGKPIGIALSGGIDSIGIAFICRDLLPDAEIHSFTAGYGTDDRDLEVARQVANFLNINHHEVITPPELLKELLSDVVWHLEDPYARSETLQLFAIARVAQKFVKTLLCGTEADALFAGMPRHKILWLMKNLPILKRSLGEMYNWTQSLIPPTSLLGKTMAALYFRKKMPPVPKILGTNYLPSATKFPERNNEFINTVLGNNFQKAACQDLQKVERTFAAWGVSFCSPFLDRDLVKLSFSISDSLKITKNSQKFILRQALKGVVPEKFRHVPKFPQRMKYDLDFSRTLDTIAGSFLSFGNLTNRGFFESGEIRQLMYRKPNMAYSPEWAMRIWTALLTEIWATEFIDKRSEVNPPSSWHSDSWGKL